MANRHRGRTSAGVMESDAYSGRAVRFVCDTPTERLRKEREGETGKHLSSKDPGRPLVPKHQTAGVTTGHPGETARSRSCRPFRACFHPRKRQATTLPPRRRAVTRAEPPAWGRCRAVWLRAEGCSAGT